jgi:general secretion pathway protein M
MATLPKFSFATLNPREQRLVTLLGIVLGVFVIVILPAFLQFLVISRRSDNESMRDAIQQIQTARTSIRERQSRRDSIIQRYASKAPPLAGFIEQTARAQKLEVTDSQDRNLPGKKYEERTTTIHLKKAGMYGIAKFLESLESKGHAVRVSRLNVRKRAAEQDSYDVEVGVTAWDRIESTPPAGAGAGSAQPPEKKP